MKEAAEAAEACISLWRRRGARLDLKAALRAASCWSVKGCWSNVAIFNRGLYALSAPLPALPRPHTRVTKQTAGQQSATIQLPTHPKELQLGIGLLTKDLAG